MRAAYIEEYGGPANLKVGERADPTPAEGEVLIRNRAAGVGIWDVKFVAGMFGRPPLPMIPGFEAAGIVESAPAGAAVGVGDEVYAQLGTRFGGYAEHSVAAANHVAPKPVSTSFEEAVGLVVGAGTAYEGLVDRAQVQPGEAVLITAASGGVGTSALQIAASQSARVMAVASSANHALLRELGAAETFDYQDARWVDQVRSVAPDGVDVLFDATGDETRDRAVAAVRGGGRAVFIVGPPPDVPRGITSIAFSADPTTERLRAIAQLVDSGQLRPLVDSTYSLDEAAQALAHVATRHSKGRVALRIG